MKKSTENKAKKTAWTIREIMDEVAEKMCDLYCRYRYDIYDEDLLESDYCSECPLKRIM